MTMSPVRWFKAQVVPSLASILCLFAAVLFSFTVLDIEPRALLMLGKCSASELQAWLSVIILMCEWIYLSLVQQMVYFSRKTVTKALLSPPLFYFQRQNKDRNENQEMDGTPVRKSACQVAGAWQSTRLAYTRFWITFIILQKQNKTKPTGLGTCQIPISNLKCLSVFFYSYVLRLEEPSPHKKKQETDVCIRM